ncbi:MAG: hypothetical protein QME96_12155 [Myxococcota bacterium]|nr:hypothetical protein [Myxococcota bacterium]
MKTYGGGEGRGILLAAVVATTCAAACGASLGGIADARDEGDIQTLLEYMGPEQYSYVRRHTVLAFRRMGAAPRDARVVQAVHACIASPTERPYVRAECALTAAAWGNPASAAVIIAALPNVGDGELRYWMATALVEFDLPEVWATIEQLRDDPDFLVYTAARDWTEKRQAQPSAEAPQVTEDAPVEPAPGTVVPEEVAG